MNSTPLRTRILYFIRSERTDLLELLIANNSQSR